MIKCNINKGSFFRPDGIVFVRVKGGTRDVLNETVLIVVKIYQLIKEQYPETAEQYKRAIGTLLDQNSSVWEE